MEGAPHAAVLLYTNKPKTTALYKALSIQFAQRGVAFAEARVGGEGGADALAEAHEVDKFPALLVLQVRE